MTNNICPASEFHHEINFFTCRPVPVVGVYQISGAYPAITTNIIAINKRGGGSSPFLRRCTSFALKKKDSSGADN
jgi:hypothetical protein